MRTNLGRSVISSIVVAILLVTAVAATGLAQDDAADHEVVGRWTLEAEPGGSVWAFQPSGMLIATGPGEILSEGTWTATGTEREFDIALDVVVTGQALEALGQVSPDGTEIALYVTATEATRPDDWRPWPAESRLIGERFGMMPAETPVPSAPPLACLRPDWVDGEIDWDRCDEVAS
jgi:hypothetical protein